LDKSNKVVFDKYSPHENVKGTLTSESFNTYSSLLNPRRNISFSKIAIYLLVIVLLIGSAIVFISSIRTAFFNQDSEASETGDNIKTIKTSFDDNEVLKVENVTLELSQLFNIPVGVRILELESDHSDLSGLCVNDIIVEVSGMDIRNIEDMDLAFSKSISSDSTIVMYKVFRNGVYKIISPYED